jgi:hypothetical protein
MLLTCNTILSLEMDVDIDFSHTFRVESLEEGRKVRFVNAKQRGSTPGINAHFFFSNLPTSGRQSINTCVESYYCWYR